MMFKPYNPNPAGRKVGDCVIRAIAKVTGQGWDEVYLGIAAEGFAQKDMPSSNAVWGAYLMGQGWRKRVLPDTCPNCFTVKNFCGEYGHGTFLLATGSHVVAVESGDYFDTWDSGDEPVVYYFEKEEK